MFVTVENRTGQSAYPIIVKNRFVTNLFHLALNHHFIDVNQLNGPGLPFKPAFTTKSRLTMILDLPARAEDVRMDEKCEFWRTNEKPLK